MSDGAMDLETLLARIYVDRPTRERFLANPVGEARRAGLAEAACLELSDLDRVGLQLAVRSFEAKRRGGQRAAARRRPGGLLRSSLRWLLRR